MFIYINAADIEELGLEGTDRAEAETKARAAVASTGGTYYVFKAVARFKNEVKKEEIVD